MSCRSAAYDPGAAPPPSAPTVGQAVFLDGRPFPERPVFPTALPAAARTFHVSANASPGGDGSRERPWKDLQAALRALSPGDRLSVGEGSYAGPIRIDASCRAGTPGAPIQVVFEKATLRPSGEEAILTAGRGFWRFERFSADLEESRAPAFAVEGADARGVVVADARILGGAGPGGRIGAGASDVVVANSSFARSGRGAAPVGAMAISIEPGSSGVRVVGNRVFERPSGAVRVGRPAGVSASGSLPPPKDIAIEGNTFVGSRSPAVLVTEGAAVRISGNTILSNEWVGGLEGRGIVIEGGTGVRIEGNHVVDAPVSVQVGWVDPDGSGQSTPVDVLVARNYFERRGAPDASGVDVEAGEDVRIANNVFDGVFDGVLLFGAPPRTARLVIANNLLLGVSRLAFRADDLSCASVFDGNLFSPGTSSVPIEIGGARRDLRRYLFDGNMRRSRLVPGVRILHKDLGRIEGVKTRDSGIPVEGVRFEGRAPDLGLAEH